MIKSKTPLLLILLQDKVFYTGEQLMHRERWKGKTLKVIDLNQFWGEQKVVSAAIQNPSISTPDLRIVDM